MKVNGERIINIHSSVEVIGHNKAKALIGLHGFTGCDTTGSFRRRGKVTWWKKFLNCNNKILQALVNMGESFEVTEETRNELERFVCEAYCSKYKGADLCESRWHLFRKCSKSMDLLPPTKGAFLQHVNRANFQCRIWKQANVRMQIVGIRRLHCSEWYYWASSLWLPYWLCVHYCEFCIISIVAFVASTHIRARGCPNIT